MKLRILTVTCATILLPAQVMAQPVAATAAESALEANSANQPPVKGAPKFHVDHATFHVADTEKSASFYQSLFGFRRVESAVRNLIWLQENRSGFQIHLVPGREAQVQDNQTVHIAFASSGFESFIDLLNKREIPWFNSVLQQSSIGRTRSDRVQQIYLRDPDGYWIEVNDASSRGSVGE